MAVKPIYAVYKGDELLGIGTADELSELLGIKPATIVWYTRPCAKKRTRKNGISVDRVR